MIRQWYGWNQKRSCPVNTFSWSMGKSIHHRNWTSPGLLRIYFAIQRLRHYRDKHAWNFQLSDARFLMIFTWNRLACSLQHTEAWLLTKRNSYCTRQICRNQAQSTTAFTACECIARTAIWQISNPGADEIQNAKIGNGFFANREMHAPLSDKTLRCRMLYSLSNAASNKLSTPKKKKHDQLLDHTGHDFTAKKKARPHTKWHDWSYCKCHGHLSAHCHSSLRNAKEEARMWITFRPELELFRPLMKSRSSRAT